LAVPAPTTSTQTPDCAPVMVPLVLRFHCWFAPPLQSHTMTAVPLALLAPEASRHLPLRVSVRLAVCVHRWLAPPLQSHSRSRAPLVVFGASMQRLDWLPTIITFCWLDGGGLVGGGLVGGVEPNWLKKVQTACLTQLRAPLSQPAHPSTGPCWWPPSNGAQTTGYPVRQPE
jgi:hypothetical protein